MVQINKVLGFVALGYALSVQIRDAKKIQTDLKKVDNDTNNLQQAVANFNNAILPQFPSIEMYEQSLDNDLKNCTTDGGSPGVITSSQLQAICTFVTGTLFNDTKKMLNTFVVKRTQFNAAGLHGAVLDDLKQLRADTAGCLENIGTGSLSPAIIPAKSPCSMAPNNFDQLYASAIAVYNT